MSMQTGPGTQLIWQSGVVRSRDGHRWLEFEDPGACNRCRQGQGCGAALFSRLFQRPAVTVPLLREHAGLAPGQRVRAGVEPRWLMVAAAALYLLPVSSFLAGCLAADALWPRDDMAALCGGVLLALLSIQVIRRRLRTHGPPQFELILIEGPLESRAAGDHIPSSNQ